MNRARLIVAATLVSACAATAAPAQTPQAPPMTSVLAGKKFTPPFKHRERQCVEKCYRRDEYNDDPNGVGDEHALMQRRLEACQGNATAVYVVRRRNHTAYVGQQATGIHARGCSDLECCRRRTVEPLTHSIEVDPDGADDRREVRDQGQHSRPTRAVRRLQL